MLSESSRNQKSMWTKLPAALRWISAVHHCTLCDTYHQLNTKHDKELLRNNLLFNSVQYSEVLQWKTTKPSHQITRAENSCHCFGKFICQCMKNTMDDENVRNMDVNRVQLLFHNWISGHATASPSRAGDRDPRTCPTGLQHCLAATRHFFGEATVSATLHKSGLCGRVARWQKTGVYKKALKDSKCMMQKTVVW